MLPPIQIWRGKHIIVLLSINLSHRSAFWASSVSETSDTLTTPDTVFIYCILTLPSCNLRVCFFTATPFSLAKLRRASKAASRESHSYLFPFKSRILGGGISSSSSEESVKDGVRKAGPSSTLIEFTAEPGENPLQVPGTSLVGDKDSLALSKSASSPLIWLFSGVEKRGCGSVAIA